jgi:hypothetical protein
VTRLFEAPEILLGKYTHGRIGKCLWYLASNTSATYADSLTWPSVPWDARKRGLLSIGTLYERLFAPVCTNYLGHLGGGLESPDPLNAICYMWWDIFPHHGKHGGEVPQEPAPRGEDREAQRELRRARSADRAAVEERLVVQRLRSVDNVILYVMARTLRLESEACREGVLHGLGHWHGTYPERTEAIIDAWLSEQPRISQELREYAMAARIGHIP